MFTHSASWAILQAKCMERSFGILNAQNEVEKHDTSHQGFPFIASFPASRIAVLMVAKAFLAAMPGGVLVPN